MKREEFDAWEQRIHQRAELLWSQQGMPDGPRDRFQEEARELVAIEENPSAGQIDPRDAAVPVVEEASLMRNLGEFPTLTDQGEEQTYPDEDTGGGIRLSDDDASDEGGVLPDADLPDEDFADAALNDADLASLTFATDQAAPSTNADINDDGIPDEPSLDEDPEDDDEDDEDDDEDDDDEDDDDEDDNDDDGENENDDDPDGDRALHRDAPAPAHGTH